MKKLKKSFGQHYLVEFIDCNPEKLKFVKEVGDILSRAAKVSETTMLEQYFWQFDPVGVTGMIMIAESHFSVHTWPEDNYAAFDILTCGEMYPEKAIELIKNEFEAQTVDIQIIDRGY